MEELKRCPFCGYDDIKVELLKRENEIEKIDHLNAPVKYKEIYMNNAKKEE